MIPTQLTVLTSASASACKMSPVRYSIMASPALLIIPVAPDFDPRLVRSSTNRIGDLLRKSLRVRTNPFDQFPGKETLQQKFGLLSVLQLALPPIRGDRLPVDLIKLAQIAPVFEIA